VLQPFYLGLVDVLVLFGLAYTREIPHSAAEGSTLSTEDMKILASDYVDLVIVANLVKRIITGSYNPFVKNKHGRSNENISSVMLKIKISTSVIVVCFINRLRCFVSAHPDAEVVRVKLLIFGAFLATAFVLGILEFLHVKSELIEAQLQDH